MTTARARAWPWSYPAEAGARDLRVDFLRGLAILFVIVDHINLQSLYHVISHERIGVVSGAELFVVLSGLVLGMVYRRRAAEDGWNALARRVWSRTRLLYLTSLAVVVATYALSLLPLLEAQSITTWTDEGSNKTYFLYGTTPLLADYPVPPRAVLDVVMLNVGPFQFNVMGLYVVLLAVMPLALRLLLDGRWWILLGMTWSLYLVNAVLHLRIFPSQFEVPFPLLSWQLLFFNGMVVGFFWRIITDWFGSALGRLVLVLSLALYLALLVFAWNNPSLENDPFAIRLHLISEDRFRDVYNTYFPREFLGILRVVNVAALVVVAYGVLTKFWAPLNKVLGWLLVPLGGATLYVFILHVFFALIVANIPILEAENIWINTMAHTIILLLFWLMVKQEFLFRWIPR